MSSHVEDNVEIFDANERLRPRMVRRHDDLWPSRALRSKSAIFAAGTENLVGIVLIEIANLIINKKIMCLIRSDERNAARKPIRFYEWSPIRAFASGAKSSS
jgi:hypothetical protein